MPRIRAVEALVAEREVADDVAFNRRLQPRPLKPGWIAQMAARNPPFGPEFRPYEHIAAKAFDKRQSLARARGRLHTQRSVGKVIEHPLDDRYALLGFANA